MDFDAHRPNLDHPDEDPRLWLEEIEGARALAWVGEQSAATRRRFGTGRYEQDRDALRAIYDSIDKIPAIVRRGGHVYNLWQDAGNPRGLWRRTTLGSYRQADPDWEILLDLDRLASVEGKDWVWAGAALEPRGRTRAMLRLSLGGSDAVVLREFDIEARSLPADGFHLPAAKGGAVWLEADTLLLSSAWGDGMATRAGYARTVRVWSRGTEPEHAPVIFTASEGAMSAWASVDRTARDPRIWFFEKPSFFDTKGWLGNRDGPDLPVDLPTDSHWDVEGDHLIVKLRTAWSLPDQTHASDTLLGLSWSAFVAGDRHFHVLFRSGPRRILDDTFWTGGRLVLSISDDLAPEFEVVDPASWTARPLDTLPRTGVVNLRPIDDEPSERTGEVLAGTQDPLTPPSLLLIDVTAPLAAPALLKVCRPFFDSSGLTVTRHEAVSVDGERIPYTQVGPVLATGDAPVHLTGYGGFGISEQPVYHASIGKLWLERGGTAVRANIRGGGEFGTPWHDAGRLAGKYLAHEDFAAVASDLVQRGVTRAGRIAAEGGSNGGLLIANMLVRHPDKFGALLCTIPLIDMRRYAKLLAGASWIAEYGDPDVPADWAFLQRISAYHTASDGQPYPPILIATTRADDRVHPAHARKMAKKLQELGYPAYLYEPAAGGHGYGKDNAERAAFVALGLAFLRQAIGFAD